MKSDPPRWVTLLLRRVLPPEASSESILGDLREEWSERRAGLARNAWYAVQAALLALHYGVPRLVGLGTSAVHGVHPALSEATADVRLTCLRLGRSPVQLALIVIALGLGVAAPATMFTIVAGITRDLDLPEPDRLVHVAGPAPDRALPAAWLRPLIADPQGMAVAGLFATADFDLSSEEGPAQRIRGSVVSDGLFQALGVQAARGRVLEPADHAADAPPTVVLSWDAWQTSFAGDAGIVGRVIRMDGVQRTVVGVMPHGFHFRFAANAWIPLDPGEPNVPVEAVGRLRSGATVELVQARVAALSESLRSTGEMPEGAPTLLAQPLRYRMIARETRVMAAAMVVLVSFVLLIACADVANLLIARAFARTRETAVRVALGAGRWRIVRQHLAEGLVVAALGGVLGMALAAAGISVFERETRSFLAYWMVFRLDLQVLGFSALLVLVAASITGLLPAIQSRKVSLLPALQEGGRGGFSYRIGRVARYLVDGEIALSCALLVVAGLMGKGVFANLRTDGGFETETMLTARYELRAADYPSERVLDFHRRVMEELASVPGISGAALSSYLPGVGFAAPRLPIEVDGEVYPRIEDRPKAQVLFVSPGFFETMGSALSSGRELTWRDGNEDPLAVVVNEAFVRRWMHGRDPLGALIRVGADDASGSANAEASWARVVGVSAGVGLGLGDDGDGSGIYLPLAARPQRGPAVLLRATEGRDPAALASAAQAALQRLDADLPLFEVGALDDQIANARAAEAVFAVLFLTFGAAGLVLAAVGLYGLLAFTVGQRTRELGVRVALGAGPTRVVWLALRSGVLQLAGGLLAGSLLAAAAAPVLGEALRGTDPRDPLVYGTVAAVLAVSGVLASLAPVHRVLNVDVVTTLRSD